MNIKSLLLGSAAALVAVSGARAADAIIPIEPEPVEYVRICDIYGAGFYYIPGTETCLQISGYVRYEHRYESEGNAFVINNQTGTVTGLTNLDGDDDLWYSRTRGRLNFDARQETDLGTLRAYYRLQATYQDITQGISGDANVGMDRGFVQLGGFTAGYLESLWVSELAGGGLTAFAGTGLDGEYIPYGFRQVNQLNYTFSAAGFNASVGLESDGTGDFGTDVLAKVSYSGGFGAAWLIGAYDERTNVNLTNVSTGNVIFPAGFFFPGSPTNILVDGARSVDDGGFSIKGGVALQDLLVADSLLKVQGHYSFDPTAFSYRPDAGSFITTTTGQLSRTNFTGVPLEWSVEAGYTQGFGQIDAGIGGIYGKTFEIFGQDSDYYGIEGNLVYNFTDRFFAGLFLTYEDIDVTSTNFLLPAGAAFDSANDEFRGFLRIQRSF